MGDRPTELERGVLTVRGRGGQLVVRDGALTIATTSLTTPSEVTIPVGDVRGATLEAPSGRAPGWLHVSAVGGSPPPPGQLAAVGDPYTVPLGSRHVRAARRFVRAVEQHVHRRGLPGAGVAVGGTGSVQLTDAAPTRPDRDPGAGPDLAASSSQAPEVAGEGDETGGPDWLERLRVVADLHREGVLTDEELAAAKERLLTERTGSSDAG